MATPSNAEEALTYDTLAVITDRLKLLATRRVEMWWDIGCLLDAMATRGFARGVGVKDYAAYAEKVVEIPRGDARRLRRIAHLFSREVAMRFGLEKLELLVQLVECCHRASSVVDPMRVEVLSLREDATVQAIPFAECTADDLRFSMREMARALASDDPRCRAAAGPLRDALDSALRSALGRKAPKVKVESDPNPTSGSLALFNLAPDTLEAVGKVLIAQGRLRAKSGKKKAARAARK
jgi:hypothetical protein